MNPETINKAVQLLTEAAHPLDEVEEALDRTIQRINRYSDDRYRDPRSKLRAIKTLKNLANAVTNGQTHKFWNIYDQFAREHPDAFSDVMDDFFEELGISDGDQLSKYFV